MQIDTNQFSGIIRGCGDSVSVSKGGQMSWHVSDDLACRGQPGLHVHGRRKEWVDGGEEQS